MRDSILPSIQTKHTHTPSHHHRTIINAMKFLPPRLLAFGIHTCFIHSSLADIFFLCIHRRCRCCCRKVPINISLFFTPLELIAEWICMELWIVYITRRFVCRVVFLLLSSHFSPSFAVFSWFFFSSLLLLYCCCLIYSPCLLPATLQNVIKRSISQY